MCPGVGSFRLGAKRIMMQLFADDLALMDVSVGGLQRKLNLLSEYCSRWGLSINKTKTKIIVFKAGRLAKNEKWHINGERLEAVNQFDYLGVTMSSSLSWSAAIENRVIKATKALNICLSNIRKIGCLPVRTMLKIFDMKIVPVLLYGCELWGLSDLQKVENVATRFYRILLSLPRNSSIDLARGELGRPSLKVKILTRIINFWLKLITSNRDSILYNSYLAQFDLAEANKRSWGLNVKNMIFSLGFGEVWYHQGVGNVDVFLSEFKQRVLDIDCQEWHGRLSRFGILRMYRSIKDTLSFEAYLDIKLPRKILRTLTRFRGGLLPFEVNTARWQHPSIPYENRICTLCNHGQIEDEHHVLFICPVWNVFRKQLPFTNLLKSKNLKRICSLTDPSQIKCLVRFLNIVVLEREEIFETL